MVGVGSAASRGRAALAGSDRPTPNFVSHTTPLTVTAELGRSGSLLYVWLLVGRRPPDRAVWRREPALGLALAASLLALFVHALFYSGFLEDPLTWLVLAVARRLARVARPPQRSRARERAARAGGRRRMSATELDPRRGVGADRGADRAW